MIFRLNSRGKIIAILASDAGLNFSLLRGFDFISLVEDEDRPLALSLISTTAEGRLQTDPVELRLKLSTVGSSRFRVIASRDKDLFLLALPLDSLGEIDGSNERNVSKQRETDDSDELSACKQGEPGDRYEFNAFERREPDSRDGFIASKQPEIDSNDELDSSKQRARLLFDKLPLALLVVARSGIIQAGNTVACKMFDYSATQLATVSLEQLLKHDNTELELNDFLKRMIGRSFHTAGIRANNESFPVEVHSQFLDDNGDVLLLSIFDISKQEELERFKRDLLKVLRHGVRGPMTSLRLFLGTLKKGFYRTKSAERLEARAQLMFDETSKLIQLTSDLLAFEKLDSDPASYDWTIISVPNFIRDCINQLPAGVNISWSESEIPKASILSNADRLKKAICDMICAVAVGSAEPLRLSFDAQMSRLTICICASLPEESQDSAETDEALLNLSIARVLIEACGGEVEMIRSDGETDKILIGFVMDAI